MKAVFLFVLLGVASGCTYDASFRDCTVTCSVASPECPGGFTCSTTEGMCRTAANVGISCAAVLDGGMEPDGDPSSSPDAAPSPDADPYCLDCDPLTGGGCATDQLCGLGGTTDPENGEPGFVPGCISSLQFGSGTQGDSCATERCAPGYYCTNGVGNICYQICTPETTCPAGTSCGVHPTWSMGPCGIGWCR